MPNDPQAQNARLQEAQGLAPDSASQRQLGVIGDLEAALAEGSISQEAFDDALGSVYEGYATAQQELDAPVEGNPVPGSTSTADPQSQGGPGSLDPSGAPEGVQFASGDGLGSMDSTASLLARATDRPGESVRAGLGAASANYVPPDVIQALPALIAASKDPNAPAGIQVLLDLVDYHANKQPEIRRTASQNAKGPNASQ